MTIHAGSQHLQKRNFAHRPSSKKRQQQQQCTTPYVEPTAGTTIQAYTDYQITWDPSCLGEDMQYIDIYAYLSGSTATAPLHRWASVSADSSQLTAQFSPAWYNATAAGDQNIYLQFVLAGDPAWATTVQTGPIFSVSWNGTTPAEDVKKAVDAPTKDVSSGGSGGLSAGGIAAAVAVPLLVSVNIVASTGWSALIWKTDSLILALVGYIWWSRRKSKSSTKRWSSVVEKRMSQLSQAPSFPNSHARNTSYAFSDSGNSFGTPQRPRFSTSESMREIGNRNSRVSFAAQTSPTKDRQRSPNSISFPKVGQLSRSISSDRDVMLSPLSPEQESPAMLTSDAFGSPAPRRHHAHKSSLGSALRYEVVSANLQDDETCAGALSVIQGTSRLSKMVDEKEAINDANDQSATLQHARQASDTVSLKMPRLARNSLDPDQALAAYSSGRNQLPTSMSMPIKKTKLTHLLHPSASDASLAPKMTTSPSIQSQHSSGYFTPSASSNDMVFTPNFLNQPSPAITRPESAYSAQSAYSQTTMATTAAGLGIHANVHLTEDMLHAGDNRASVYSQRMSTADSVQFFAQ